MQRARAEKSHAAQLRFRILGGANAVGARYDWGCQITNRSQEPFFDIDVMATMAHGEILWSPRINVIQSEDEVRYNFSSSCTTTATPPPLS